MGNSRRFHYAGALAALVFLTAAAPEFPRPINSDERAMIEREVRRVLIDPESARFRWAPQMLQSDIYCGFVNARNSMGGYTGFKLFMTFIGTRKDGTRVVALAKISRPIGRLGESAEEQMCANYGYPLSPMDAALIE